MFEGCEASTTSILPDSKAEPIVSAIIRKRRSPRPQRAADRSETEREQSCNNLNRRTQLRLTRQQQRRGYVGARRL